MFRDWPEAVNRSNGRYTLSFSGDATLSGANHLWPLVPDALTADALDDSEAFFRAYRANWSIVYADALLPGATRLLKQRGFVSRWYSPLMVRDDSPRELASGAAVQVIRASTSHHLQDIRRVMSEAFMTGDNVNYRVVRESHLDDPAVAHYVVYSDGIPASCATVAFHDGLASIWNVATRRRFRRRGFAKAIMKAVLEDIWARGCAGSTLMASSSGRPLYEQLGFREVGRVQYVGPPAGMSYRLG